METGILIGIVIGITEVIKRAVSPNKRFLPLISLTISLIYVIGLSDMALKDAIITGVMVGLSASGLWSGSKTVLGK